MHPGEAQCNGPSPRRGSAGAAHAADSNMGWRFSGSTRADVVSLIGKYGHRKGESITELQRFLQHLLAHFDFAGFDALVNKHIPSGRLDDAVKSTGKKYFHLAHWLPPRFFQALEFDLHQCTPRAVLDIGTGFGYFPFVCRYFGHHIDTIDVDGNEAYNDVIRLLEIPRTVHAIRPGRSLPDFGRKFDLVTAFMVTFNTRSESELYGETDWTWFLTHILQDILAPDGLLYLRMNDQRQRRGLHHDDPGFEAMLKGLGLKYKKEREICWIQAP